MTCLPLVSIAIITFNQKKYLKECIESCLNQTYKNYEIVVADDGSTDGTHELLKDYSNRYPGVFRLEISNKNTGITNNSNKAHFACGGKYIAWMGGDDLMHPDKISIQVNYMEAHPECAISYHNLEVFDSQTNNILYYFNGKNKRTGDITASIRFGTFNGACSTMVRRCEAPKSGFNINIPIASDWLYWIESLKNGGKIFYIDNVLGRYRRHSSNVTKHSNSITQNEIDHLNTCNYLLGSFPQYYNDILYAYSNILISLRYKLPYLRTLLISFIIRPRIKVAVRIFLFFISFGYVKV